MHSRALRRAGIVACLAAGSAAAQPTPETQALRREIEALRADYEGRLKALEQRLQAAEAAVAQQPAAAVPSPSPSPASAAAPQPLAGGRGLLDLSLILSGQYVHTRRDPANYRIRGFLLPPDAEIGPGTRGFSLAETELTLSASIDPWLRGVATVAFSPDNEAGMEEAFIQTTSLGHGLGVKAGRFLSNIGYLNPQHAHAWDFADAPLAYQAMLGTQFRNDGLQLTWLAPTERFFELGLEAGRGRGFPGSDTSRNGAGALALTAHVGDDIGTSHSWRAGVSMLRARASDQALAATDAGGNDTATAFAGRTRVWIADAVWKWAPQGNATRRNFKLQAEYLRSTRDGDLVVDPAGLALPGSLRAVQSGWYLQGVYQFMPRWRVGLRTERLDPGTPGFGPAAGLLGVDTGSARKNTVMVDFNPSEFSRIRLQVAQDRARPAGVGDLQWWLQYQMSLGAHGAHGF
ncbi:hypothetical protein [Ramlibacter sp. AN1133]|uniref:hypothetical protein n=1 Tax=Ramlibacter sp. AN1133 TaxID=3133429 RepID=UPI0030BE0C38